MGRKLYASDAQISAVMAERLETFNYTQNTEVASGQMENLYVYAPDGEVGRTVNSHIVIPSIAGSTGTHMCRVLDGTYTSVYLRAVANGGGAIAIQNGEIQLATVEQYPSDKGAQNAVLRDIVFSDEYPMRIEYANNTDLNQAGTRKYVFPVLLKKVK